MSGANGTEVLPAVHSPSPVIQASRPATYSSDGARSNPAELLLSLRLGPPLLYLSLLPTHSKYPVLLLRTRVLYA